MKSLKLAKFHIRMMLPSTMIYYMIFIMVISFLAVSNSNSGQNSSSSGLEFSTVVFLFIMGLNAFKENFNFSQANNLSRKAFFSGLLLAILPIAFLMSIIDLVINRIYNIFVPSPTNYDMIYGTFRDTGMFDWNTMEYVWKQSNTFFTLSSTVIWQFAAYVLFFALGVVITMVYFRSNNLVKVIVSVAPIALLVLLRNLVGFLPKTWLLSFGAFIDTIFGWQTRNPYMAVLTFFILSLFLAGCFYLLLRKAEARE
ncbi:hypothetical protein [Petrocella sp. FN5]|uniref:hypothetical protein n=1 Tax=Petrocella sp. FN5 TaxID=3032002 RepID=UPI0023DB253F|nr:hypothetical protein [Petrocella sp. FN5]MDF1615881.1 hypothetical protein [Petrocella sp. FN5]